MDPKGTKMKLTSFKRSAVAGVAALTLVGTSLGVVSAQQLTTTAPSALQAPDAPNGPNGPRQGGPRQGQPGDMQQHQQEFMAALAARLGISTDQLQQAMDQARADVGMPERGPGGGGPGPRGGERGPGADDQRQGGAGPQGEHRMGMGGGLDTAAQALGISTDQLRQELPGKSLADVAQAHNVDPTTVANALKTAADAQIDQAVADGRISSDQADAAKQRASERIDQMMAQAGPAGRQGWNGGPGSGR
jgi:transposase-like protein